MKLEKFSFGMGDRFLHQGRAQLQAIINAKDAGVEITPVWNKSDREHVIVGTEPLSLRDEADAAVSALNWDTAYRVDADHTASSIAVTSSRSTSAMRLANRHLTETLTLSCCRKAVTLERWIFRGPEATR
jgi:hypothetical protein